MNPSRFRVAVFLGFLVALAAAVQSAEPWPLDAPKVDPQTRQLLQDRNYAEAVRALDAAMKVPGAPREALGYLKGRALYLSKQYDAAIAVFDQVEKELTVAAPGKQLPANPWLRRTRFAKALALVRKGDFRTAAGIYRAEAESLLSAERRQQIAEIYLGFARTALKPPKEEQTPDYAKALEYFNLALAIGLGPEKRIEAELAVALCHEKSGNPGAAAKAYARFFADHPDSPQDIEARYALGKNLLATGDFKGARRVWQDLLAKHADPRSPRVAETAYHLARTWRIPQPTTEEELNLGVGALLAFIDRFPTHELAGQAHLDISQSYIYRKRHADAAAAIDRFLKDERMKGRKEIAEAWFLLGQVQQAQKKFPEAIATWRQYVAQFPAHERWNAAQQEIVNTEYLMGIERYKVKDYPAAVKLLTEFLAKYPLDARGPGILLLFGRMQHEQKHFEAAIAEWRKLISKHPDSEEASTARFMIARTLEKDLGKLDEALEEYRKIAAAGCREEAQQSIARLTATTMSVVSPRPFRSSEVPKLTLSTRNIESVSVRAYKIDLETYFRKTHAVGAIESLDIGLIDPDVSFEFKVPNFAKHRLISSQIEVPLPEKAKSGVMAVTVSSKSMEATALLIQTDLEVIVKSSRDEVFLFAENMLTRKPWAGVRVLVSASGKLLEATTNEQGVLRQPLPKLSESDSIAVLAVAEGHIASNRAMLKELRADQGLVDKGYLYTDRPVYRAGEPVRVRGCLRAVAGDTLVVEKGKKYMLEVLDSRNRPVRRTEIVLGEFGSFQDSFNLPATTPQGKFRIVAHDRAGHSYQGAFEVQAPRQELIRLAIDTPRHVYYRGEAIEGTVRAAFYDGTPLVGREVRYQVAGGASKAAQTDAKGEARFQIPTREFNESQTLSLVAALPEQNLFATANVFLATQGFLIAVSANRSVFLAGEPFEATIKTTDPSGKPVAEKLVLKVFDTSPTSGKPGERLIGEYPIQTSAEGIARQTLKIEKGGPCELRVEGTDRFKNRVSSLLALEISGDEDDARLLLLADRNTLKAGETADVQIVWREEPALALVTFEGSRVLDYKLVELKRGINKLAVPISPRLAPNFDLAVAVMADPRPGKEGEKRPPSPLAFHEAKASFTVERDLNVKLAVQRKAGMTGPVRPGEELNLVLTTTDPLGRPTAAELSLAMVEQSQLDRVASPAGSIQDFFRGPRRTSSIQTSASIAFSDRPATRPINPRLLAERERQEIAEEEEASRQEVAATMEDDRGPQDLADLPFYAPQSKPLAYLIGAIRDAENGIAATEPMPVVAPAEKATAKAMPGGMGGMGGFVGHAKKAPAKKPDAPKPEAAGKSHAAAAVVPPASLREMAYWNPAIVTGKDGTATVPLVMPDRSTAWSLSAKGITADTLAGEATQPLVVKKDFFAELKLPRAFTEGDEATIPVTVQNDAIDQGPIEVGLKTTIDGQTVEQKQSIQVKSKGLQELAFKVALRRPEKPREESPPLAASVAFELSATGKTVTDTVRRTVPLSAYGTPVYRAASGSADADTSVWVEYPKDAPWANSRLQIIIGPTVEQGLLDAVVAPEPVCRLCCDAAVSPVETATSDLLASLALQKLIAASREAGGPQAAALDGRIRDALSVLLLAQREDGGWSWTGSGSAYSRETTARAVWAIQRARLAGYPFPDDAFGRACQHLQRQLAETDAKDLEGKAILLHALSVVGKGDFTLANLLHRQRSSLSPVALAYLALALAEMDRKPMAAETLDALAKHKLDGPDSDRGTAEKDALSEHSSVELHALDALASQAVAPKAPRTKALVDWLLAHRAGHRWSPDRATGPATAALCAWFGENRFQGEHYKLTIAVNGAAVQTLDVDQNAKTQVIDVPTGLLGKDKQKISFQLAGRGRYTYQCVLGGFVPADQVKSTTTDWTVERSYEPAPRELDGKELPRGFDVVRSGAPFRNAMTQLPVGRRGLVELVVRRKDDAGDSATQRTEYLVITEPIPGGAEVIESSIRGGFDRYEIVPGAIVFYLGKRDEMESIRYELHGYLPGNFRAGPTVARSVYRPERMAVAPPASLAVLPLNAPTTEKYRLSPRELLELGRAMLAKGDRKSAAEHLGELVEKWDLAPDAYKQAVGMLLDIHLELGPPEKIVHYFEIVRDKWPEQEIPFAKIVKVGAAYQTLGEFERGYLVFRATVESSFTRESGVAGFLDGQGEFVRSVDFMTRLIREYPPEPYAAEAEYALAQRVAAKASEAASDPKLRERRLNRVDLLKRAAAMLESFLTTRPEDPAADQASFAEANALLDLKDYAGAAAICRRSAARYPTSELADAFLYLAGYCEFALGHHDAALELCRKVADAARIDPKTGQPVESPNKRRAIYIMGQIYHRLGRTAEAIREYRRVADQYTDARQAIASFLRQGIALAEVTTLRPDAPPEIELKFRNLAACDVKVYRIDLMKFSVLKGDLNDIAGINLAGIRPIFETTVKLGDGNDYRDRVRKLELPVKKEGAYLIVCRGGEFYTSGLVLVTPLTVEVEVDRTANQVRAMIKDVVAERYLTEARVKVIGGTGEKSVSGEPDLRGVFVAEGIHGAATVIAEAGPGRYAFYRDPSAARPQSPQISAQAQDSASPPSKSVAPAKPAEKPSRRVAEEDPFGYQPKAQRDPYTSALARTTPPKKKSAQEERPANAKRGSPSASIAARPIDMGGLGQRESERRILAALDSPTKIDADSLPLSDLVLRLKELHRIEIQLDSKALEEIGVATDTPVNRHVADVTLRSALRLVLRDLGLSHVIRDEVLLITSPDVASSSDFVKTKLYPVADLVIARGEPNDPEFADYDSLIDVLQNTVASDTWQDVGGNGTIEPYVPNLALIVSQSQEVHERIEETLNDLRRAAQGETVKLAPANVRQIEAALDSPTRVEFKETPLKDAIDRLARDHRIPIKLDAKALEELGVATDLPLTRSLSGVTLRSTLDLLLRDLGLAYTINDEVLLITSPDMASSPDFMKTVIYPAGDLAAFRDSSGEEWADWDSLVDLIQNTVATDTWQDVGGNGTIEPFQNSRALVITQTIQVHREVAQLLEDLRRAGGTVVGAPPRVRAKPRDPFEGAEGFGGVAGVGGGGMSAGYGAAGRTRGSAGAMMGGGMGMMGGMGGMGGMPLDAASSRAASGRKAPASPSGRPGVSTSHGGGSSRTPPPAGYPGSSPKSEPAQPAGSSSSGSVDLLEGVRHANQSNQTQQLQRLQKRYQGGGAMGGMGGMMGGGVGAGNTVQP